MHAQTRIFLDTLSPVPPSEPLAVVFLPADRQRLVEALDSREPEFALEILRQHLAGVSLKFPLDLCVAENERIARVREARRQ